MRNAFAKSLTGIAEKNDSLVFLSGDIGNRLFDEYKEKFPKRFYNCGVAEANMIGVAAGLALSGMQPIAYTITPFITSRCFEQIRVDVCYHNLPIVIVGVGSGLSYAGLGATHHSMEDISIMRSLPHMQVLCPADPIEVRLAVQAAVDSKKPSYIRLGKKGEPCIHKGVFPYKIGKAQALKVGGEVALLSTGNILPVALEVQRKLESLGINASLYSFHTVKPLDKACLEELTKSTSLLVTIEEHSLIGGFGSAVAEWLCDSTIEQKADLLRIGSEDSFFHQSGSQNFAREYFALNSAKICEKILAKLQRFKRCELV